jgi:hypothetical protein
MRVYNPSSTATVVVHDSAEGFSNQWQPGIRNVTVGPLQTVAVYNVEASNSKSLKAHLASGALQMLDMTEPADAGTGKSLVPGLPIGMSVVLAQPVVDPTGGIVVLLPAGCGIGAVTDYVVVATCTGATPQPIQVLKAAGQVTVIVGAAGGTADLVIYKIV